MESEVTRMLTDGIIQVSTSPWRAQASVVRDGPKPRMVINYPQTIYLHTSKHAFSFPNMQDLFDQTVQNTVFSKIDLKSADHQIPLHRNTMPFTAFGVNGRLSEFTRLPFGVTNAVAAFQREMTAFVRRHNLKQALLYLDDVITRSRSEEEHQENLKNFLKATEIEGLTLNKTKPVPMLGHIVGAGSKRPDPSRIKTLMDFPISENSSQLKRFLGFFAYSAKWVADYSNKVALLLAAQKQLAFLLNQASRLAITTLKKEVASALFCLLGQTRLVLQTDASGTGIGATLNQGDKPIGFFSRTLKHSEMAFSVVKREAMAILEGFRRFSDLLRTSRVLVRTDQ